MLKTNSKKAIENIRKYIAENFTPENYTSTPPNDYHDIATFIYDCFVWEAWTTPNEKRYFGGNEQKAFIYWASGLPSVIDTCYYYDRSAVDDLGIILEETETEKERFTEAEAAELLTALIYREIKKEVAKNEHTKN